MSAGTKDLTIEQGATFALGFVWHTPATDDSEPYGPPVDLTGATARMQIRSKVDAPILLNATTENGKIILGGTDGRVDLLFTPEDTDAITVLNCVYDLKVKMPGPDGRTYRFLQGAVTVSPNVTTG